MFKRLSLLLAAMFVVSMMFVAPVFASGNGDNNNGDEWSWCDDNGDHNGNSNGNGDVSVDVSAEASASAG
jgi:hypothetical protein